LTNRHSLAKHVGEMSMTYGSNVTVVLNAVK